VRSTLFRTAALSAVALGAVTGLPAHAAAPFKTTAITDASGDGNGLNGQGLVDGAPATSTPSDYSGGDIVSIAWTTLGTVKKPTGFKVVMTLAGAPSPATIYRVTTSTKDCSTFWLTYTVFPDGPTKGSLQHNCPGFTSTSTTGGTESDALTPVVKGSTITWTVTGSDLPKAVKKGTAITGLSGETRFMAGSSVSGGATVPVIDAAAGDGTFTYGK
jgi:hypothetical protein